MVPGMRRVVWVALALVGKLNFFDIHQHHANLGKYVSNKPQHASG